MDIYIYGELLKARGLVKQANTLFKTGNHLVTSRLIHSDIDNNDDEAEEYTLSTVKRMLRDLTKIHLILITATDCVNEAIVKYTKVVGNLEKKQAKQALDKLAPSVATSQKANVAVSTATGATEAPSRVVHSSYCPCDICSK